MGSLVYRPGAKPCSPNFVLTEFQEVRSESGTSGGREFPCPPSREELTHGQEQTSKRRYDEHHLVDVIFAGRQSAY